MSTKRSFDKTDWDDDEHELVAKDEKRLRLGLPNHWRARNDTPERYQDIHLVKIRENCKAIIASRANNLISMPIYSFSVNVLCFKRLDNEGTFVPIEIGICAYSVKAGRLGKPYHVLIDAGLPLDGCVNAANDHAAATHKITIPPFGTYPMGARKDYRRIYKEIVNYTKAGERTILVWDSREMQQIIGSLEWLYKKASQQSGPGKIPTDMLGNTEPVFIIHYYINMLLEVSIYDHEKDIMCDYHQNVETKWCARSCAIRMFLTIERVFEEIYKGYVLATNPAFLRARMAPQPILYDQHRPSQQYLSDQAREASAIEPPGNQRSERQNQESEPVLALPAPNQSLTSKKEVENDVSIGVAADKEPIELPLEQTLTNSAAALRDPRIRA